MKTAEIKRVTAVYFSPAGHTAQVTELVAGELAYRLSAEKRNLDFTLPSMHEGRKYSFEEELVVFGCPTYAGRVPNKVLPWIQTIFEGNQVPAIALVTYGNRNFDSSLTELQEELSKDHFAVFAAAAFPCSHVFSGQIAGKRPDAADKEKIRDFAGQSFDKLTGAEDTQELSLPLIRGGQPVGPYYVPKGIDGQPAKFLKAKPKIDLARCNLCGTCSKVCPMGSIDSKTCQTTGICIKCQACISHCSRQARYFDDAAFLSHVKMLEENCRERKEAEYFL